MKTFYTRFLLVLCVSLAFCGDDEKYSFIYGGFQKLNVGENWKYRVSHELSFTIPEIGFIKYSTENIETIKFLGTDGEFGKMEAILTEMESDNYVNGLEIMDHYREAMENSPCYLYINIDGAIEYINPVKDEDAYLQEAFEAAYMNIYPHAFRYPFGKNAVDVAEGDSWGEQDTEYDHSKFYVNMGSPPSHALSKTTFTLKKVREKKGRKIATVEMQDSLILDLYVSVEFMGERRLLAGHATGTSDAIFKWDLDSGEMLKSNAVYNFVGDFEMEDKSFHMSIFQRDILKKVK